MDRSGPCESWLPEFWCSGAYRPATQAESFAQGYLQEACATGRLVEGCDLSTGCTACGLPGDGCCRKGVTLCKFSDGREFRKQEHTQDEPRALPAGGGEAAEVGEEVVRRISAAGAEPLGKWSGLAGAI